MLVERDFFLKEPRRREEREGRKEKRSLFAMYLRCAAHTLRLKFKFLTSRLVRGNRATLYQFLYPDAILCDRAAI
jgi:hypothetical protein